MDAGIIMWPTERTTRSMGYRRMDHATLTPFHSLLAHGGLLCCVSLNQNVSTLHCSVKKLFSHEHVSSKCFLHKY